MNHRLWLALSLLCSACAFDRAEHPAFCNDAQPCKRGFSCVEQLCLEDEGSSSGADSGGKECEAGSAPDECYSGAAETKGVGECRPGQRVCVGGFYTPCLGEMKPAIETCNGKDDDCNGQVDDIDTASCDTHRDGICGAGTISCSSAIALCEQTKSPAEEVCNAKDDDCDGSTDEVIANVCYPKGEPGCKFLSDGSLQCKGLCAGGVDGCNSKGVAVCKDAVTPVPEKCTGGGGLAKDDNCNGEVDEDCACTSGQSRDCYAGPDGTDGKGACHKGTQACVTATLTWGECLGQVLPTAETCENIGTDDDCNDVKDDVPALGDACIDATVKGLCRNGKLKCTSDDALPVCVGSEPTDEICDGQDQDCDGQPDNGFDFNSNETCGSCDLACTNGKACCGGRCVDPASFDSDIANCGGCGVTCGSNQYCCQGDCLSAGGVVVTEPRPRIGGAQCQCEKSCGKESCCGTECVDLRSDLANCGSCGNKCKGLNLACHEGKCTLL